MRSYIVIITLLSSFISFNSSAANITIRWVGKVPTTDCISKPLSNQTAFKSLSTVCQTELKQEYNITKKENMVTFDI
ncbi:hypothetical protein ERW51_08605 [Aliivibrio finisterrensis]|uniref:hypothetical protein n=1 Tax=Aliivibrio finisterrensis TaxID=511998 RepID=UPI00101FAA23|nr:hypothetical protein [Aliivibrio finisterrensis]RYU68419.1 hypothetical protein ERW54_08800 [Aliivibrio finisterrensis]RYU72171.1 hypothetical protein ERW51_08605 [Aliivibrio finisterrensis]RYU75687.1 hypothetical protein ERW48_07550 [Aliivibrio finisterrensis]